MIEIKNRKQTDKLTHAHKVEVSLADSITTLEDASASEADTRRSPIRIEGGLEVGKPRFASRQSQTETGAHLTPTSAKR